MIGKFFDYLKGKRTIILNTLFLLASIFVAIDWTELVSTNVLAIFIAVQSAINILLRFSTTGPVFNNEKTNDNGSSSPVI